MTDCPNCGQELDPGAAFCGDCGQPLTASSGSSSGRSGYGARRNGRHRTAAPAYALPRTGLAGTKETASFIFGIIGLAGWLVPVVGLSLGTAAIAFGTMSLRQGRRRLAMAGIVLGSIVVVLSLFAFAYNAQESRLSRAKKAAPSIERSASTRASGAAIDTACYASDINVSLGVVPYSADNDCTFTASDAATGDEYSVKAMHSPALTKATLAESAKRDIQEFIRSRPGAAITGEQTTTFAGSTAYGFTLDFQAFTGRIAYVLHDDGDEHNVFIIARFSRTDASLDELENGWVWK